MTNAMRWIVLAGVLAGIAAFVAAHRQRLIELVQAVFRPMLEPVARLATEALTPTRNGIRGHGRSFAAELSGGHPLPLVLTAGVLGFGVFLIAAAAERTFTSKTLEAFGFGESLGAAGAIVLVLLAAFFFAGLESLLGISKLFPWRDLSRPARWFLFSAFTGALVGVLVIQTSLGLWRADRLAEADAAVAVATNGSELDQLDQLIEGQAAARTSEVAAPGRDRLIVGGLALLMAVGAALAGPSIAIVLGGAWLVAVVLAFAGVTLMLMSANLVALVVMSIRSLLETLLGLVADAGDHVRALWLRTSEPAVEAPDLHSPPSGRTTRAAAVEDQPAGQEQRPEGAGIDPLVGPEPEASDEHHQETSDDLRFAGI